MKVKVGDKLPDAKVFIFETDPKEVSIKEIIAGKKNNSFLVFPVLSHQLVPKNTYQDL